MITRLTAGAAALLALVAALVQGPPASAAPPDPATDPFFVAPANLASLQPGAVIRSRVVRLTALGVGGVGSPMPPSTARQVLVRSTDSKGRPAAVTATVITPLHGVRHQLVAYDQATDSLGAKCEPSFTLQTGTNLEGSLIAGFVLKGFTVVVPDHQGPRHAYAAGRMAGHATLDSIRAALAMPTSQLAGPSTQVGAIGYSGGAIAAGWAAQLQRDYAPELNMVGVVSGGTPADLEAAGSSMNGSAFGGLFVAASVGMSREYPELASVFNAKGIAMTRSIGAMCTTTLALRAFDRVEKYSDLKDPMRSPVAQAVLADNKLGGSAPTMPYLLWHSKFDELIPWSSVDALDKEWCGRGADVRFVTNRTSEHISGAVEMYPTALGWLIDRFDGKQFVGNCPTA